MNTRRFPVLAYWLVALATLGATFLVPGAQPQAAAADALREETSLGFVQDDVALYVSAMRNREQVDRFLQSNAFAKLQAIPVYQMGLIWLTSQWNAVEGPLTPLRDILETEEGQNGLAVIKDAVSHEIFFYADGSATQLFELTAELNRMNRAMQIAQLKDEVDSDEVARQFAERMATVAQKMEVPQIVIGFRVEDAARARQQLDVLEPLIRQGLAEVPELAEKLARSSQQDGEFLTLTLSGEMIPWEQMAEDVEEEFEESFKSVRDALTNKQIVVALGVRGQYVLLSVAGSVDALKLPQSPQLLIDRSEFEIVRKHADKPITSVSYASKDFMTAATQTEEQFDDMKVLVTTAISEADMDEELQKQIITDVDELVTDLKRYIPKYGAVAGVQFMTEDGVEGYVQNWTIPWGTDGSQPLTILQHVGGRPLMAAAGRQKNVGAGYEFLSKWFDRGAKYLETAQVRDQLDDEQQVVWDHFAQHLPGLCERFDKITRASLIPALKDGQSALIMDAQLSSVKWQEQMPQATTALPMPQLSIICGLSDASLMRKAFADYWSLAGDTVKLMQDFVREHEEEIRNEADDDGEAFIDMFLAYEWRFPTIKNTPSGEIFEFPIPEQAGLDAQIVPSLGIANDVMVASVASATTERLMRSEALDVGGALSNVERPLASAVYVDFAGMIEMLKPWIKYAVDLASNESAGPIVAMAEPQVLGALEVLQCMESYSAATTVEGDSLLMHSKWTYRDLK